ncbi:MAG: hypothetical protein EAZ99_08730 [Alphaproteobacteria bacterium]|nr:MAG: hypothetical protein EAZ99_08730 [Alphaproteobacteria bacterium]
MSTFLRSVALSVAAAAVALACSKTATAQERQPLVERVQMLAQAQPTGPVGERLDQLFQRMLQDPTNLELIFEFARLAIDNGDLEGGIMAFERLLILNPDLPRVRYELGALYYRLNSLEIARVYLQQTADDPTAPEDVRAASRQVLAQISDQERGSPVTASVTFGFRYQSNANSGPNSGLLRSLGDDIRATDSSRKRADSNLFVSGAIRYRMPLAEGSSTAWDTDAVFYGTRQFALSSLDLMLAEVRSGVRFAPIAGDSSFTIRPHVVVSGIGLDYHWYQGSWGVGVDVQKTFENGLYIDGQVERRYRAHNNFGTRTTNTQLDGWENGVTSRIRLPLTETNIIGADLGFRNRSGSRDFNDLIEFSLGGNYTLRFPSPVAILPQPWTVTFSAQRLWTDYSKPDPSVDLRRTREDREWRFGVTGLVPLEGGWSTFVQLQQSRVDSSLTNYEYRNFSTLLGITRSF